ncbi:sulfite exporter TauE/SafE family protein [Elioraea tepidiphila]|uniref:sulfite exporter TauE/SafE family protein n=1 Tax=Elioraea tepidiphila TaxID=457934 RepID=UPI00037A346A|nr:sulfite exporter TauE/SafE family protein [Elioraea tepidiphila]
MLEPWQWAAALILALAAGAISGISGFGAGLMLSAYLLPILGARITVPVLAVAMVLTNAGRVWAFRDSLSLRIALPVLAGVLPGALAGAYAFGALGGAWADLIVGGFLIVSVVLRRALAGQTLAATPLVLAIGGAATGLLSGITTGAGMLLIPLLLGAGLPARALIATDAFVSGSMHVARVAGYAAGGVLGPDLVVLGLALGAATVPGSRAAAWLVARIPPWKHVVILEGLVVVIGAMTVWGAVRALRAA